MHELSLARELVTTVEALAQREHFTGVKTLELSVGALSCVETEALRFAIDAVKTDTCFEQAQIHIVTISGELECRHCGNQYHSDTIFSLCPECQHSGARIVGGDDMQLTGLEVYEM